MISPRIPGLILVGATLSIGAILWLKIDPTHQLFEEAAPAPALAMAPEPIA